MKRACIAGVFWPKRLYGRPKIQPYSPPLPEGKSRFSLQGRVWLRVGYVGCTTADCKLGNSNGLILSGCGGFESKTTPFTSDAFATFIYLFSYLLVYFDSGWGGQEYFYRLHSFIVSQLGEYFHLRCVTSIFGQVSPLVEDLPIFCVTFHSSQRYRYGQGACFWKVPWTFRARKASWQTAIRLLWKADLLTCFLMSEKTKSIAKFDGLEPQVWWLRASPLRRYKGNCGVRNRPERFRNFWETGLGSNKISVMHYWLEEQSKTETCIIYKGTSASTCRVSFLSRVYTIHTDKQRSSFRACHVFNFRHMQRKTCAHATCLTGNTR